MSRFNTPFLSAEYYALFTREPYQELRLTGQEVLDRMIWVLFGIIVGIPILAIIPARRSPHEPMGLWYAATWVLLGSGYYLYQNIWRPWRYGPPGYRLVGEFEVREKDHLFSKCWVRLLPGENFLVQVPAEPHERLRVGSHLRLTY